MYPNLFGIENFSYILCMILGIISAFGFAIFYTSKKGTKKDGIIDLLICSCFAVASGLVFSIVFENIYELIEYKENFKLTSGMTFYGGLFGGVVGFLLTYYFMRKNVKFLMSDILKVAPVSITLGHAIGRIGCFLGGCCYGKETDSWIGMHCSQLFNDPKVIPTQLFESIFLFVLFIIMAWLLFKKDFKFNFVIYMVAYGTFRFVIEFFRDDPRGKVFFLSPSQVWCIALVVLSVPCYFLLKRLLSEKNEKE